MDVVFTPKFNKAIAVVLKHEGGYSNDPDDPGGETNFGITAATLKLYAPLLNITHDVKNLTVEEAKKIYKVFWWDKFHYELIISTHLATKILDMAVNMGAIRAHRLVQVSLQWCGENIAIDGYIGAFTISALNKCTANGKENLLYHEICEQSERYYTHLVNINPKLKKYLDGWTVRAWS